jgi:hypothetical protein
MLKIVFRAALLVIAFLVVLKLAQFVFLKVLFFGMWLGMIGLVGYLVYSLLKRA